jgi:hypothetical protein
VLWHWESVIHPFLAALDSGPIVEIGAAAGATTVRLADLAAERGIALHAVDPAPQFDVAELERRFEGTLEFHRQRSHDALEAIGPPAAVLIDGDHNWHTVHGELTRLEEKALGADREFPLVMLHDVEWPYARRDMYYDPDAIPDDARQPWARLGIRWKDGLLDESGLGVNSHLANAREEGGPRNGVLTAVEDFVAAASSPLQLRIVHGDAGLGVLVSTDLLTASPELRRQWERLRSPEFLLEQVERLSEAATRVMAGRIDAGKEIERLRRGTASR